MKNGEYKKKIKKIGTVFIIFIIILTIFIYRWTYSKASIYINNKININRPDSFLNLNLNSNAIIKKENNSKEKDSNNSEEKYQKINLIDLGTLLIKNLNLS